MARTLTRVTALLASVLAAPAALAAYSVEPFAARTTGSHADAAAIGDVNGDGRNDVVLTTTYYFDAANDYRAFIYLQNPDGSLAAPVKVSYGWTNSTGLALADLDRDGRAEIIAGHSGGITVMKWGPFRDRMVATRFYPAVGPQSADDVVAIDANRDGNLDIVSQSWSYGATVYFNDGKGLLSRTVAIATPPQGYNDMDAGDFNDDGYQDFVVFSGQGTTHAYIYYNDGTDDFSPPLEIDPNPGQYVTIGASASGDFNHDGRDDLMLMSSRSTLGLFAQTGAGGMAAPFALPTQFDPNAMLGHDLNRDGRDDLIVLHGGGGLGIYFQGANGLGAEQLAAGPYATWLNTQGLAVGDINGDHCDDIVVANSNHGLVTYAGRGCTDAPDLVPSLGLTANRLAVRLDNSGTGAALQPQVEASITVANGTLALGTLPAGCVLLDQAPLRANVRCTDATLAAGTSRTQVLSLTVSGGTTRNALSVTVRASTPTVELRTDNNVATRRLRGKLDSAPSIRATVSPRPAGLLRVGRDNS